jgi:hypothetical protein
VTSGKQFKYPLGTIAVYGPDNTRATKLVASVLVRPTRTSPSAMQEWRSESVDVRQDESIAAEVAAWFASRGVKQTVSHERIIGCPHQAGVDYPIGRTCPRCPFWANLDRFTHEPIVQPTASMTPDEVLAALSVEHSTPPLAALESADAHRDALVEPLLQAIDAGVADPENAPEPQALLFAYALYLMARWRETRAFASVLRWLSLPGDGAFAIAGDVLTQDGGRILAAVCDGDLAPIRALILHRDADEFSRSAGVSALARLAAWGEVARERVVAELLWLAREGLEREASYVWDGLASECADIEALEVFPEIRRAYAEQLIDPMSISAEELDKVEASPRGLWLDRNQDGYPPIGDVADATSWWAAFHKSHGRRGVTDTAPPHEYERIDPYRAPPKVGRNEPCPCGSGRKYKKCCGA